MGITSTPEEQSRQSQKGHALPPRLRVVSQTGVAGKPRAHHLLLLGETNARFCLRFFSFPNRSVRARRGYEPAALKVSEFETLKLGRNARRPPLKRRPARRFSFGNLFSNLPLEGNFLIKGKVLLSKVSEFETLKLGRLACPPLGNAALRGVLLM